MCQMVVLQRKRRKQAARTAQISTLIVKKKKVEKRVTVKKRTTMSALARQTIWEGKKVARAPDVGGVTPVLNTHLIQTLRPTCMRANQRLTVIGLA
jgi:hypothetical protein